MTKKEKSNDEKQPVLDQETIEDLEPAEDDEEVVRGGTSRFYFAARDEVFGAQGAAYC